MDKFSDTCSKMSEEKPPPSYEEITLTDDKPTKNTTKIGKSYIL